MSSWVGAVARKVQLRLLEDGDQVGQPVDHRLAFAQLVGIVEVGEVAGRQLLVGAEQRAGSPLC